MRTCELSQWAGEASLDDAVLFARQSLADDATVFVSAPARWQAIRVSQDIPADAFELLVFDGTAQLRWIRRPGGGRTAVTALHPLRLQAQVPLAEIVTRREFTVLERRFLCWGAVSSVDARAATIGEPRLGHSAIQVPVSGDPQPGDQLIVRAIELVADIGDGTQRVVDQMILAIEPARTEEGKQ